MQCLASGSPVAVHGAEDASPSVTTQDAPLPIDPAESPDKGEEAADPDKEVKRYKIALLVLGGAIFCLFWFMLVLALLRSARFHKRRILRNKAERTEYVDAWSQYRLDDQDEQDDQTSGDNQQRPQS